MGRYHLLISREKGTDLFKLEFKGALNKSVPFCSDPHGKQYFSLATTFEKNFSGYVVVPKDALK